MAMVYAQSTSEIQQTVISMQPDIEFSCQGGQDCPTANGCGLQFHPIPIDNGYSNVSEYDGDMYVYNVFEMLHA